MKINNDAAVVSATMALLNASDDYRPLEASVLPYGSPCVIVAVDTDTEGQPVSVGAAYATVRAGDYVGSLEVATLAGDKIGTNLRGVGHYWVREVTEGSAPLDIVMALMDATQRDLHTATKRQPLPKAHATAAGAIFPLHTCGKVQSVLATGLVTCQPCASASAKKSTAAKSDAPAPDASADLMALTLGATE